MRCGGGGKSGIGGWGGGRGGWAWAVGVAQGWRGGGGGTAPGKGDAAARRAQFDWACGARTRGEPAAWREAVLTGRSVRGARRCRVIGCVP